MIVDLTINAESFSAFDIQRKNVYAAAGGMQPEVDVLVSNHPRRFGSATHLSGPLGRGRSESGPTRQR